MDCIIMRMPKRPVKSAQKKSVLTDEERKTFINLAVQEIAQDIADKHREKFIEAMEESLRPIDSQTDTEQKGIPVQTWIKGMLLTEVTGIKLNEKITVSAFDLLKIQRKIEKALGAKKGTIIIEVKE